MATISCPTCGKPLRPGARFCGSCGATIPPAEDTPIHNEAEQAAPDNASSPGVQAQTFACPYCGKPARVGAKFCNYCGKEITPRSSLSSDLQVGTQGNAVTTANAGIPARSAGPIPAKPAASVKPNAHPRRKSILPIFALGLGLLCIFGSLAGYLYLQDPFSWRQTSATVSVAIAPSATMKSEPTQTATNLPTEGLYPSSTPDLATDSPTPELLPTDTATLTPAITVTLSITSVMPLTGTIVPKPGAPPEMILLEDEFSETLSTYWKAWGEPRPTLRQGFGDSWLELKAADKPTQAGVTCRTEVSNAPGTMIEFLAQLTPGYPQYRLYLDWDPLQYDRGPNNTSSTIIHLEVQKNLVLVQAPAANHSCQVDLDGTIQHRYILRFITDKIVELYVDEGIQPRCSVDMGIKPVPGRISFTGNGWVTRILVTGVALP